LTKRYWANGRSYEGIDPRKSTVWKNKKGVPTLSQSARTHEANEKRLEAETKAWDAMEEERIAAVRAKWIEVHSGSGQM